MKPCKLWEGTTVDGYGYFMEDGKPVRAYIRSYEKVYGKVPEGKVLHHKCENKLCCEETHLEPLTRAEHQRIHRTGKQKHSEKCLRGHDLTKTSRIYYDVYATGCKKRICIECRREDKRRYRARKAG